MCLSPEENVLLTGSEGLVALDSPAGVGDLEGLNLAVASAVIEVDGVLEPLALAVGLRVEADVDNAGLALSQERVGSGDDADGGEGQSDSGGELHFDGWFGDLESL